MCFFLCAAIKKRITKSSRYPSSLACIRFSLRKRHHSSCIWVLILIKLMSRGKIKMSYFLYFTSRSTDWDDQRSRLRSLEDFFGASLALSYENMRVKLFFFWLPCEVCLKVSTVYMPPVQCPRSQCGHSFPPIRSQYAAFWSTRWCNDCLETRERIEIIRVRRVEVRNHCLDCLYLGWKHENDTAHQ